MRRAYCAPRLRWITMGTCRRGRGKSDWRNGLHWSLRGSASNWQSRELQLPYGESYLGRPLSVPLFVMRARRDGPRVFVTGVLHGDELNGMGVVRDLLFGKPPELSRGHAQFLFPWPISMASTPIAADNARPPRPEPLFSGFAHGQPDQPMGLRPLQRNRAPMRLWHRLAFRRGSQDEPSQCGNMRDPGTKTLAMAFGSELIVNGKGPKGSLRRTARGSRVPTIILEAGEVWKIEPSVVEIGVRGIFNVLKSL